MNTLPAVVIAAGGTGGHIYPAMAIARELEAREVPIIWIGTKEGLESQIVREADIDIRFINVSGLRGSGIKGLITGPFKVLGACVQSMRILADVEAATVLGMGGFVSGPVGIAALVSRRALVLHEQNAVAGMTNKWLARFATRVYSAMPNVFPEKVGALAIGNPVRESIEALGVEKVSHVQEELAVEVDLVETDSVSDIDDAHSTDDAQEQAATRQSLNVLVVGGSRGARILNQTVPQAMQKLAKIEPNLNVNVWHQTGPAEEPLVRQSYVAVQSKSLSVKVSAYIEDMTTAYKWADVMVCRSGAMTVSELSAAGLPSVLIPYPNHSDDQQTLNAQFLTDAGAAVLMPQQIFNASELATQLQALKASPDTLPHMAAAAQALHRPNAATIVADALQEVTS